MPDCPCCDYPLEWDDYFGPFVGTKLAPPEGIQKNGDIYQCRNEECEAYQDHFHNYSNDPSTLYEGYPC